jgi:hypothetical protein
MKSGFQITAFTLTALLVSGAVDAGAAPVKLTGSIAGIVRDNAGVPQMGASVLLFNRYERMVQRALTNEKGIFGFELLTPEVYSVRVSLASFVPAVKHKIEVQPGMQSLLYINMASLLSSVELVYAIPGQGALMSDDWRWTLKTSTATRPVLRILPQISISDPNAPQRVAGAIFSETRGLVRVSAGDSGGMGDLGAQSDLGTAFALATSLFGRSHLQVSGNLGLNSNAGAPAASFRTSYSRDGIGPEVAVTVRQVYLPARSQQDGLPPLRSMSLAMLDHIDLTDNARLEYGMSLDSVSFFDRLNYFSPFARLTYDLNGWGSVRLAYSSGAAPSELFSHSGETEAALHQDLAALSLLPGVTLRDARARVARTQSFEIGYEKKISSRTYTVTAFRELVSNGALTMAGPEEYMPLGDIMPDLSGRTSTFNIGSYQRTGYSAGFTQSLGEHLEIGTSAGRAGVLNIDNSPLADASGDEIRSRIHTSQRYWAAVRATGTVPVAGTQITGSYEWTDYSAIMPSHLYLTQGPYPQAGLNIHFRQPIPGVPGMPGRLEATADLRNMLAQGYVSLPGAGPRPLMLMQAPRTVRGGLSFIF